MKLPSRMAVLTATIYLGVFFASSVAPSAVADSNPNWSDRSNVPTVYFGSSTVQRWRGVSYGQESVPFVHLKMGYGGATIPVLMSHTAAIPTVSYPHEQTVVVYAGENDLQTQPATTVFENYTSLIASMRKPGRTIVLILPKISPARTAQEKNITRFSRLVKTWADTKTDLETVNANICSKRNMFVADAIHYNSFGYNCLLRQLSAKDTNTQTLP